MVMAMILRLSFTKVLLCFLMLSIILTFYHMLMASGEQSEPKAVLLRLEDVGPGGEYSNMDQLGKLRAVLEYLGEQGVHYQIGVIPKWVNYSADQNIYDKSLDQTGDLYVDALVRLLRNAADSGAVIGMHGYTHQVGEVKRQDGHQESGIGNEFNVEGLPLTQSPGFAEERLTEGLRIFEASGLKPAFWETPHYHGAAEQYPVFSSHFGILYENELSVPNQTAVHLKTDLNTHSGAVSRGAAYVPTPYSYIPYNKDEKLILDQLGKTDRLPSFFYHAFLEFKHLVPVTDANGEQLYRDGMPEYRYPDRSKTNLQKLIVSIKERGYRFYSLMDYVPFTPYSKLPAGTAVKGTKLEDVTGDGQLDTVQWKNNGVVEVRAGEYRGWRNDPQTEPRRWAVVPKQKGDLFTLKDANGDGKADLWIVRAAGLLELYRSEGESFTPAGSWKLPSLPALGEVHMMKQADGSLVLAVLSSNGAELIPYYLRDGEWKQGKENRGRVAAYRSLQPAVNPVTGADQLVYCRKSSGACFRLEVEPGESEWSVDRQNVQLPSTGDRQLVGDFNGDGLEDLLIWEETDRRATVYRQKADGSYIKLSSFGPWGMPGSKILTADLDGNGKLDIAVVEPDGSMDTALSYQMSE
jgi:hypothetical protein